MPNISRIKLPNNTIYTIVDRDGRLMIAENFDESKAYSAGDYVVYNGQLWELNKTHYAGDPWDDSDASVTTVTTEIKELKSAISGGVHYRGKTTTPIYDEATTNPIIINGNSYTAQSGDMVIMSVVGVSEEITSFPATIEQYHYYNVNNGTTDYYGFYSGQETAVINKEDLLGKIDVIFSETASGMSGASELEFIWDGSSWNALGGATAFGELAFKDQVSGTYWKPTGSGSGIVTKALGTVTKKYLSRSSITAVEGTTGVSKMTAGTAVNVATVDTAKRYGTANVGDAVVYGTANRASSATTVGNANVGQAVAVATQGSTFYYGTADVDSSVTVATAGTDVVYGKANVGTAVTYGNANVGATTQNVAIASGATAPYAVNGVVVSMDQEDSELLVISNATTATMTTITGTTSIVQAVASNTTLTPAVAAPSTQKLTPVGGTTSITPAKSAGTAHSAVGVGGTTNITPAVTSTTSIYGAVAAPSTQTLTPATEAPNTQTIVPAKANGSITPWSETAKTVALAAASTTSILTGEVQDSYAGGSPQFVYNVETTSETVGVSVGMTPDSVISK